MFFKANFLIYDSRNPLIHSFSYEGEDEDFLAFIKSKILNRSKKTPRQRITLHCSHMGCHIATLEGTQQKCLEQLPMFISEIVKEIREIQDSIKNDNPLMNAPIPF